MNSFRVHIFVVAMVSATLILLTALFVGRWQLIKYEETRTESRLCMELRRLMKDPIQQSAVDRIWNDMVQKMHVENKSKLAFKVEQLEVDNTRRYVMTESWPEQTMHTNSAINDEVIHLNFVETKCTIVKVEIENQNWILAYASSSSVISRLIINEIASQTDIRKSINGAVIYVIPLCFLLSVITSYCLTQLLMKPIIRLTSSMHVIDKNELHIRVNPEFEYSEFRIFINSYNGMLERLEKSFLQTSRFAASAAHELRTPLTILQGKLDHAINSPTNAKNTGELSSMLDEVTRLTNITKKLLLLTQAENGELHLSKTKFDICIMLNELITDMEMLSHNKVITQDIPRAIFIFADELLVRQALINLISNAIKYAPDASTIQIRISTSETDCFIHVKNDCDDIPITERERFFDYFFRRDTSRSLNIEGSGLGLNVALEIAKSHGGNVYLEETPLNCIELILRVPRFREKNSTTENQLRIL